MLCTGASSEMYSASQIAAVKIMMTHLVIVEIITLAARTRT